MTDNQHRVGTILLNSDEPTSTTISQLHTWVIWQFPKNGNPNEIPCGAVCPPSETLQWLPAKIDFDQDHAVIYGHLPTEYATPEAACGYFKSSPK